jgi:uncharacterized protein (TIGR03067 family)
MTITKIKLAASVMAATLLSIGMFVVWSASSAMLGADELPQRDTADQDSRRIQGTWSVVELHQTGHRSSKEEKAHLKNRNFKIEITGDTFIYRSDESELNYRLDTTQKPKVIDYLIDGKVIAKAIYELKGHDLKICQGRRPDRGKPKAPSDFNISKANPGTFPTLFVMKRDAREAGSNK